MELLTIGGMRGGGGSVNCGVLTAVAGTHTPKIRSARCTCTWYTTAVLLYDRFVRTRVRSKSVGVTVY